MMLKPAFQLDISWRKLVLLAMLGVVPFPRKWLGLSTCRQRGAFLVCDSVRSGFVSLLQASRWPRGSEILFTFPTISAMPALAINLGYEAVSLDCQNNFHPASVASVRRHITAKTKALVIAPLLGCRVDLAEYRNLCDEHGIMLIEDAAQGYEGRGWPVKGHAHCAFFSFGLLKRSSCLKGGLLLCEDQGLQRALRVVQKSYRTASRGSFYKSWLLAAVGKIFTGTSLVYGASDAILGLFGRRISTVLLALARPKKRSVDHRDYEIQPHRAFMAAIMLTVRGKERPGALMPCCRLRLPEESMFPQKIGLWPSVAVVRENDRAPWINKRYDFVAATARLCYRVEGGEGSSTQQNARKFVETAFFVHDSWFDAAAPAWSSKPR